MVEISLREHYLRLNLKKKMRFHINPIPVCDFLVNYEKGNIFKKFLVKHRFVLYT